MIRTCTACGGDLVPFLVPDGLGTHAPVEGDDAPADAAALCSRCLRTYPEPDASDATTFDAVADYFPRGDGGAAVALLLGMLDSLALNRAAIETLVDRAEREGADVLLTLDRIDGDATLDPHFDVGRRRTQVEQLLV
ncbi:DUF6276 family protein [Halopelagius longus]|uniref:Small CPxCG-related zinc finger protein n=1 Tax=Halopelagius longus TaxID=1236180 RepID=A0A1H1E330_9EURY|nr:DUF6276 family protein [Halopelagius longus]RDI71580.1 hypothetical protein DWB78_07500 [Halopelagius longus]SDQ83010.1 hypothetical protein SAMN05216278_2707 [Halopelagius longus]